MEIIEKWGRPVVERGFAQIPNYLLLLNTFLEEDARLSPIELLVLLQLVGTWWKKESMPFPSMATLAKRCGVSERQIQRTINKLVESKIIERSQRKNTKGIKSNNIYNLNPLVEKINLVAKFFPNEYARNLDSNKKKQLGELVRENLIDKNTEDLDDKTQENYEPTV